MTKEQVKRRQGEDKVHFLSKLYAVIEIRANYLQRKKIYGVELNFILDF